MLAVVAFILFLLSVVALVLGLISPPLVLRRIPVRHTRPNALFIWSMSALAFLMLFLETIPEPAPKSQPEHAETAALYGQDLATEFGSGESAASDACDPSVMAIRSSMALGSSPTWVYQTVEMKDGIAVLVSGNEAYFVHAGKVYAANGSAKAASPELDYVKDRGISYGAIAGAIPDSPDASLDDIAERNSGNRTLGTPDCAD